MDMRGVDSGHLTQELRELFQVWLDAIPDGAKDRLAPLVADDFAYTDFTGTCRQGREAYFELMDEIGTAGSRIELVEIECRPLASGAALATGEYRAHVPAHDGGEVFLDLRFTGVWTDDGGAWRYRAHHTSQVAEPVWWERGA